MSERDQQITVFDWANVQSHRVPELALLFAIPNGGGRGKSYVNKVGRKLPPLLAIKLKKEGLKSGVPDLCLPVSRGSYISCFIEMKDKDNSASENQIIWWRGLESQRNYVRICHGASEAILVIQNYLAMRQSKSVIYAIVNRTNSKKYVGSTVNRNHRFYYHRRSLRQNRHTSLKLQAAWNKYGEDMFSFTVLESVIEHSNLIAREQFWIDYYQAASQGYNMLPNAANWLVYHHHTEEAKQKMSKFHSDKWKTYTMPEYHKDAIRIAASGPMSNERRIRERVGTNNGNAKLSPQDVIDIKAMLAKDVKVAEIASLFKVSYQCIWKIKMGMAHNEPLD